MDPRSDPRRKWSDLPRLGRWGLLGFLFLGLGLAIRWVAVEYAVRASVNTVRVMDRSFFERQARKSRAKDELFPLWSWEREDGSLQEAPPSPAEDSSGEKAIVDASQTRPGAGQLARSLPKPQNARATVERVLGWAEAKLVPQGRTVAAGGGAPAGIELYGVAPLGVGLRDGDRLVSVDGRSVSERGHVIGAVLAARARKAEVMTAGLVRRTADGFIPFSIVVEQPYPEHVDASATSGLEHKSEEEETEASAAAEAPVEP